VAFSCTPLEAIRQPPLLTRDVLEARGFTAAYEAVTTPQEEGEAAPTGPMVDEVMKFVREDFDRKQEARRGI